MKAVKILHGGYGYRKQSGGTQLVTAGETVLLDDAEAKRLVALGIAEAETPNTQAQAESAEAETPSAPAQEKSAKSAPRRKAAKTKTAE